MVASTYPRALAALLLLWVPPAFAHDQHANANWIFNGGYRSPIDGSACCGVNDCFQIPSQEVGTNTRGYLLMKFSEVVPYSETQVSRDGNYWRCRFPDGRRRCFFAPPPGS